MDSIDYKKEKYYKAKTTPEFTEIPKMLFVMVDGKGAPESTNGETEFQSAMQAMFGIVYTIKFWGKKHPTPDNYSKFTLAPVEGLWWIKGTHQFDMNKPESWQWTVMLRVPEFITPDFFNEVVNDCIDKKQSDIYKKARLEYYQEGLCVQLLHVGPYDQEAENIKKLHTFAKANGYALTGKHHELYFGDPRLTSPEKLHTILRNPVRKIN